ncbi:LAME_0H14972g1_1 [Lachancea meyersii CBS 8951]|uniref:LAME_0H14972g1_1 n=1 Tax=Lachancea meyersii CBS 8951 TaxID=1266667 RepID=A0A1G4KHY8_9SACH|nr:LAME_0H14972g1_1 [Lachancea meyersii CBS 8951]
MTEEVNGKLSSRVLNMKFMRQADQAEEAQKEEEQKRQLVDSSEWKLEGNAALKARLRPQWQSVGATAILGHSHASGAVGRRKMGVPEKPLAETQQEADLETLWKSQKRSRESYESGVGAEEQEDEEKKSKDLSKVEKKESHRIEKTTSEPRSKRAKSETAARGSKNTGKTKKRI